MPAVWHKKNANFGPRILDSEILQGLGVGPGGRYRTLAVKIRKNSRKSAFVNKTFKFIFLYIFLLVMTKYWGKQIFSHGSFPEVGQKQKT